LGEGGRRGEAKVYELQKSAHAALVGQH
jgi:hypothetical protein